MKLTVKDPLFAGAMEAHRNYYRTTHELRQKLEEETAKLNKHFVGKHIVYGGWGRRYQITNVFLNENGMPSFDGFLIGDSGPAGKPPQYVTTLDGAEFIDPTEVEQVR